MSVGMTSYLQIIVLQLWTPLIKATFGKNQTTTMAAIVSKNDVRTFKQNGCGQQWWRSEAGFKHFYNIFKRDELE